MSTDLRVELAGGAVVGYAEVGSPRGSPLVHLHGSPGSRFEVDLVPFRRAAERLGIRLLAPDRPGIGLSSFHSFVLRDYPQEIRALHAEEANGVNAYTMSNVTTDGDPVMWDHVWQNSDGGEFCVEGHQAVIASGKITSWAWPPADF